MPSATAPGAGSNRPERTDHDTDNPLVLTGATVLTCDGDDTEAETEAIALVDGRVLAVDDADTVCSAAGPKPGS